MAFRQFVDVSRFQSFNAAVYAASVGAVWAPLVVVNFDGNDRAFAQWQAAGQHGLTRAPYCFATPGEDGAADVDRMLGFVKQAGGWGSADFPVLDVENATGGRDWQPGEVDAYVQSATAECARRWRPGWLYVGAPFAVQHRVRWPGAGWGWWPAAYPGPPDQVPGFPVPVAHQYTGTGRAPGCGNGDVDISWLFDESVLHPQHPVHPIVTKGRRRMWRLYKLGSGNVYAYDGLVAVYVHASDYPRVSKLYGPADLQTFAGASLPPTTVVLGPNPDKIGVQ